jgi:hypothetical protein
MITLKIPYKASQEALDEIKMLQKAQASVYHCAYNLNNDGQGQKEIRETLKSYNFAPEMDSWFIQSAIYRAMGQVKADKALGVTKKIFGGKRNFIRRMKGLITKEEFQENKLESIYLVGEAPYKGNRKFNFASDCIVFKPNAKTKLTLELPELRGKYLKYYNALLDKMHDDPQAITVTLDQNFIYLAFDESKLESHKQRQVIKGRYLGIDLNPNYIGVSFYNERKELLETKLYNLSQLTGKVYNPNKLKHEVREIAHQINRLANHHRIEFKFVEDLSFKQGDKRKGRAFNRLTSNQFLINEFVRILSKQGKVLKVNAAYSSTIGNILHSEYPDPIAASMEIARRGIESRVVKGGGLFYPALISKETLANRWKEALEWTYGSWVELHNLLKETGMKYRVDVPEMSMFRLFESRASKVLVY